MARKPRLFARDSISFPTYALAETCGISRKYAMLLRDYVLVWDFPDDAPTGAWPRKHPWYEWAFYGAGAENGFARTRDFLTKVKEFYDQGENSEQISTDPAGWR